MTKSKKTSTMCQKSDYGIEQKSNNTSHMLLDHCYAFYLLL